MGQFKLAFFVSGLLLFSLGLSLAHGDSLLGPDHFSATMESSVQGRAVTSRIYLSDQKIRLEPQIPGSSVGSTYEIILPEAGTMTMVMPAHHICMKKAVPSETKAQILALGEKARKNADLKVLGHGVLDGHPVIIRLLTEHSKKQDGPRSIKFWNATDLKNVPLKEVVTMADGSQVTIHYKDIDLSDPSPSLFVPPSNCSAFPDIKSMMKSFGMGNMPPVP